MQERPRNGVATTARSLNLIEYIQQHDGATVREITNDLDLSKSTVHKHLNTLVDHGYLTKRGEQYLLGLMFYNKGEYVQAERRYFTVAREIVAELEDEVNEDVEFVVEMAGRGMIVCESNDERIRYGGSLQFQHEGLYFPLHTMAAGKALLAEMSNDRIRELANRQGLPAYTDETITTIDGLIAEVEATREQSYAISREEFTEGLCAVSRCVRHDDGTVLGAITVCIPIFRATEEELNQRLPRKIGKYVEELEERIGDHGSFQRLSYNETEF